MSEPDKDPFIFTRRERAAKPCVACFVCGNSAYHTEAHQSLAPVLRTVSVNWAHLHTRHRSTPRCDTQKCKHVRQKGSRDKDLSR